MGTKHWGGTGREKSKPTSCFSPSLQALEILPILPEAGDSPHP